MKKDVGKQILLKVGELLKKDGYKNITMRNVALSCNLAVSNIYNYFSSKEEIFYFLVEEGMKLLKNSIEIKTSKTENTIEKLKAVSLFKFLYIPPTIVAPLRLTPGIIAII